MNINMRDAFLDELYNIAQEDQQVMLLSNDFGAPSLDKFRSDCASQFIHIGIAEQNMCNVAAGLAIVGKTPFWSTFGAFAACRSLDMIRVTICYSDLNVKIAAGHCG